MVSRKWCGLWNSDDCLFFDSSTVKENNEYDELMKYSEKLCDHANDLVQQIKGENFYELLPQIMTIDAKLRVFNFFLSNSDTLEEFSCKKVIDLVNAEYKAAHFERISGFKMKHFEKDSVLFQIQ